MIVMNKYVCLVLCRTSNFIIITYPHIATTDWPIWHGSRCCPHGSSWISETVEFHVQNSCALGIMCSSVREVSGKQVIITSFVFSSLLDIISEGNLACSTNGTHAQSGIRSK